MTQDTDPKIQFEFSKIGTSITTGEYLMDKATDHVCLNRTGTAHLRAGDHTHALLRKVPAISRAARLRHIIFPGQRQQLHQKPHKRQPYSACRSILSSTKIDSILDARLQRIDFLSRFFLQTPLLPSST